MTTTNTQPAVCNIPNRSIFEGDNLDVMRGINDNCVDLIYLDPPFNSNRNYAASIGSKAAGAAFKDTWNLTDVGEAWHNQIVDTNLPLYKVIDASQHIHGDGMKSYLIMMAVRLLEMNRILKPNGSVYLRCDDTAGAYLKVLMDSIFGAKRFRNEITWRRQAGHIDSSGFGRLADSILFYGAPIRKDAVRVPLSEDRAKSYSYRDSRGRYTTGDISAKGLSGGGYIYNFHGHMGPWRYPEARIKELEADDRIHMPKKLGGRTPIEALPPRKQRSRARFDMDRYSTSSIPIRRKSTLSDAETITVA